MTDDQSRSEKQLYLQHAILEAGYNGDKFIQYLGSEKKDGAEIDNWTLEELKIAVLNYKRYYAEDESPTQGKKNEENKPVLVEEEKEGNLEESTVEAKDNEIKDTFEVIEAENKKEEKKQVQAPKNDEKSQSAEQRQNDKSQETITTRMAKQLNEDRFCIIVDTKIINPGFFSTKYEVYVIETPSNGWIAERSQFQFQLLRETLLRLYPGYSLPPLPKKPIKRLETEFFKKRKGKLQLFLDNLLLHVVFQGCDLVTKFLSLGPEKEFEKYIKGYEKIQRPRDLMEFTTFDGKAKIGYDASLARNHNDILIGTQRIKKDLKSLKEYYTTLTTDLDKVAKTMEIISKLNNRIADNFGAIGAPRLLEIYSNIGDLFNKCTLSFKNIENLIFHQFGKYFRYYQHELCAFDELLSECNGYMGQFVNADKKLKEKKELLYTSKQMEKWELSENCSYQLDVLLKNKSTAFQVMLPAETKETAILKRYYGYYLNKVKEEFQFMCSKDEANMKIHLTEVGQSGCDIFDGINKIWLEFICHLTALNEEQPQKTENNKPQQ